MYQILFVDPDGQPVFESTVVDSLESACQMVASLNTIEAAVDFRDGRYVYVDTSEAK